MSQHLPRVFPEIDLKPPLRGELAKMARPGARVSIPRVPQIGIDYIPAMNAGFKIIVPFQSDAEHGAALSASGLDPSMTLPDSFSWNDEASVRKSGRMNDYSLSWLMNPPNQAHCGSCWAVSSSSVLTDRHSIAEKRKIPPLSAVVTASCAVAEDGHDGCQGGFSADAGCFFEQIGIPPDSCWPYNQFCPPEQKECTTASGVPKCCTDVSTFSTRFARAPLPEPLGERSKCADFASRMAAGDCGPNSKEPHPGNVHCCSTGCGGGQKPKIYKALVGTTKSLGQGGPEEVFHRMKWNLFAGGPIVASYHVFMDFMLPAWNVSGWGWSSTNGIYIHEDHGTNTYADTDFVKKILPQRVKAGDTQALQILATLGIAQVDFDTQHISDALNKSAGFHAVALVGWGVGDTKHPKYGKVRYWVVRNSWGDKWNEKGYFRIAFTDAKLGINQSCGFDYPVSLPQGLGGGSVAFQVAPYHPPGPGPKPPPPPRPGPAPAPGVPPFPIAPSPGRVDPDAEKRQKAIIIAVLSALGAAIVIIIIVAAVSSKRSRGRRRRIAPALQQPEF